MNIHSANLVWNTAVAHFRHWRRQ